MATIKQKRVANLIIENMTLDKPMTGGEIVESSGYGVSMKKNPQVVLESDGVKEELELAGFSLSNAKRVVTEIMLDDKQKAEARLKATDQVFKVHHAYEDGSGATRPINLVIPIQVSQSFNINEKQNEEER